MMMIMMKMMMMLMTMMAVVMMMMMMMMHTVKYEYQAIWQFQLPFDAFRNQNTEIITYSSLVHILWDTKLNVASKSLVLLCIKEHEVSLFCRVPSSVVLSVLMHVTERGSEKL